MKLYVLVGVAGSGKSTYAKELAEELGGMTTIISSDEYRKKLFGSLKEGNKEGNSAVVFEMMHKDLRALVEMGSLLGVENVIYDATNINRRRRRALYRNVKAWSNNAIEVEIIYFSRPLSYLFQTNSLRITSDVDKSIPFSRIRQMYINLQVPRIGSDCDSFRVEGTQMFSTTPVIPLKGSVAKTYALATDAMRMELTSLFEPHDCAPHHLERIDEHIEMCVENVVKEGGDLSLVTVALFHDLGKSVSKKMVEKNGTTKATYQGHANVSANYFLNFLEFTVEYQPNQADLDIMEAIHQHMNSHQGFGDKNIRNNNLTPDVLDLANRFKEIDSKSRIVGKGVQ